ncbi:uncharacterized protein J4E78_000144 [Alternaria triticimaculans]|uniref:uncharacterized protein n=1 Tax=Alternaria triticimaculans TaxID=297637 RepID=UPI0020C3334D|nr:uncharacterized protein J4E78_000144 [Alternaria triticimaculans]KAI4671648.1 hypothetical protein J4E78_000144 [Alternaria triticimaculans]
MSPKRKKTGHGDDPPKAKKTRSEDTPDDDTTKTDVNWFIPKEKGENIYKEKCAADYAQILYEKAREEISPQQAPLLDPQFRTPVFQKQGKDLRAGDKYRPSASLRNLFNDIKSRSIDKEEGHSITHFQQQFGDDANIAVVLSRADDNATFVLNEDQRLEVIVNDVTAHVDFIRRNSSEDGSPAGYFIQLPLNTSVTVNGTTYTNSDDSSSMPSYIGPLEGYAIIELLSQPAFFFRTAASLKATWSHRAVTQEELDRRDGNGDVALGNTRVRWGPIGAPLPPAGPGNPGVPEEVEEESGDDFTDTFTDAGEPIKDLGAYMRAQLLSHQQSRYRELIPRVLASVNYREKEATGLSYQHEGQTFRPGRTLLQPIEVEGNHLLLAAQIHADKHITLKVLDPMTWRSTLSSRKAIDEHIRETLRSSTWWRHVFDSLDQMEENLPEATMWVPAAQVTTGDGSFTYTVLNAWALTMGLAPNPSFTPSAHGHESFFIRAQQIFDLALQDTLNWRVLLAFFRCTGFVKPSEGSENDEEADLPHLSRRFDLCNRSFQKLIARQTAADAAAEGKKIDMELVTLGLEHGMRHDVAFAADSLSELERTNLTSIVRDSRWNFADTKKKLKKRLDENKEQKLSDVSLLKPTPPPPPPPPHKSTPDTEEIPADFDPCKHLHEQIKLLEEQGKIEPKVGSEIDEALPSRWSQAVFGYIEPVVRAINDLLSPEQPQRGFTLADLNGSSRYADDSGVLDTVVMMVCQLGDHVILVVLQHEDASKEAPDVSRVMDSAPWTTTAKERVQIHDLLVEAGMLVVDPTADEVKSFVGPVLQWMPGPQQAQVKEAGYFAIMSAWAVLLGLPINPEFRIGADFYDSALPLLQAVVKAHADWKLIWAFLRCVGYTQSEQPPSMQRRFKATRPARGPRITKGNRKTKRSIETQACRDINYPHFPVNTGVAHTEAFPWDDYDKPDRATRIPEMIKSGEYPESLLPQADRTKQDLPTGNKESSCAQFHRKLKETLEDEKIKTELQDFRHTQNPTSKFGVWLEDWEASHAIASVTFAITSSQDDSLGFGFIAQPHVQGIRNTVKIDVMRTQRPGRPLITPLLIDNHIVLLVIQLDDDDSKPSISVLDSKAYHMTAKSRAELHRWAWRLVIVSKWNQGVFPISEMKLHRPAHATWVPVSQQPSDNECGYYTILNGWSLALGLTPDHTANVEWTDQFHSDLQDVIHLARIGRADWSLIYNFLRCYNFVLNGEVPPDRRFAQTTALLEETSVGEVQENINSIEDVQSADPNTKTPDLSQLRHANRIALLPGRRHNLSAAFPSDKWSSDARADANDLARNGKLDLNANEAQLRKAHADLHNGRGPALREELQKADANYKQQAQDELLKTCQDHLTRWHTGIDLLFHERSCAFLHDTLNFYRYIFQEDFLGNVIHNEAFPPGDWNKYREASEINLAVSAVVAAIDDLQLQKHQTSVPGVPFAGGFSLSTSTDIAIGAGSSVSRPRRCWLMPLSIMQGGYLTRINQWRQENGKKIPKSNGGAQGHHILVVLQEEEKAEGDEEESEEEEGEEEQNEGLTKTGFAMYFYDSAPENLKDTLVAEGVAGPLPDIVSDIAPGLQWLQHRKGEKKKSYSIFEVPTSRQPHGGWQCGPHVIINAWILALGLRPDPSREYDDVIYQELHVLARAAVVGLLDWRTLVAWIFCHKLALETKFEVWNTMMSFLGRCLRRRYLMTEVTTLCTQELSHRKTQRMENKKEEKKRILQEATTI